MKRIVLIALFLFSFLVHGQVVNNGGGTDVTPIIDGDEKNTDTKRTNLHSSSKELNQVRHLSLIAIKSSRQQWKECHKEKAPFQSIAAFHDYFVIQQSAQAGKVQIMEKCEPTKLDCMKKDPKVVKHWREFLYHEHALNFFKHEFTLTEDKASDVLKTLQGIFPKED